MELRKFVNKFVYIRSAAKLHCADNKMSAPWCLSNANYVDLWVDGPRWIIELKQGTDLFSLTPEKRTTCNNKLSVKSECQFSEIDLWNETGGNQLWRFRPVPGKTDTFYIESAAGTRAGCNRFLSVRPECGDHTVDMWNEQGKNQEWVLQLA